MAVGLHHFAAPLRWRAANPASLRDAGSDDHRSDGLTQTIIAPPLDLPRLARETAPLAPVDP
jgi:hypothetical protein